MTSSWQQYIAGVGVFLTIVMIFTIICVILI